MILLTSAIAVQAQPEEVTYNILNDEPENINKLFIGFQPFYGELWATNPTIGFGLDATYYHHNKAHFRMNFRRAYGSSFDMMRHSANVNSSLENRYKTLNFFEIGGTYHIKDAVIEKPTTMVLYESDTEKNEWSAKVPPVANIEGKLRTIIGGRLGAMIYNSTADANRFIERQEVGYDNIVSEAGDPIPLTYENEMFETEQVNMFTNVSVIGMYLGASHTWIRNVSVDITGYEPNVDDLIFTTYFDLLIGLDIRKDNLFYEGVEYSLSPLKSLPMGARLGVEGKRNRKSGMAFGAEIGYRPGLKKGGFFGQVRVAIPMISTNLDGNQVNSYEGN